MTGRLGQSRSTIVAVAVAAAALLLPEIAIAGLVAAAGPVAAFAALFIGSTGLSWLVCHAFDAEPSTRGPNPLVQGARAWIDRSISRVERRSIKLARLSELSAFLVLSLTAGPLLTTVAVKLRGGDPHMHRLLAAISSALFSAVWVLIYAGGLAAVRATVGGPT